MKRVTYYGNDASGRSFREFPVLNEANIFQYNGANKDAVVCPYLPGAGGSFMLEGKLDLSNTSGKRISFTRMSYNRNGPGAELKLKFVTDGGAVVREIGVGEYFNLDPGHSGYVMWDDGGNHMLDLEVQHGR